MHAWANRILRVDLDNMRVWAHESAPYVPEYLGARGIAARICWEETPEPVEPLRRYRITRILSLPKHSTRHN